MKEQIDQEARDSTVERNEEAIQSAKEELQRLREERAESARVAERARRGLERLTNGNGDGATP